MRTTIKVTDLDIAQWEYVQTQLERAYRFAEGTPRVCVEFELSADISPTHVEMPVREFMLFLEELNAQQRHEIQPFPGDAVEGHDHERPTKLKPSNFPGCPPVRFYADGCMGSGPYEPEGPAMVGPTRMEP